MIEFGLTCEAIASTPSKIEKVERLAQYFRKSNEADLEAASRYFTGSPLAKRDQKSLNIGGSAIIAAAKSVWGFRDEELSRSYREHGDLGSALAELIRPPVDLGLFRDSLGPASLKILFDEIANATGKSARKRRIHLCERLFASCSDAVEAKYIVKIMTGDLRIGLREGLVLDAITDAFSEKADDVRRANMASGDIGTVAVAAKEHALHGLRITYGSPLAFMLASPVPFGSTYKELEGAEWQVEFKYDGIRAQAHKFDNEVRLFSRTLNEISHSYPEVVEVLKAVPGDFILDGELVAHRDGQVLPFRYLQARLQRKSVGSDLLAEVPVTYFCFDLISFSKQYLLDEPLQTRRSRLNELLLKPHPHLQLASWKKLEDAGIGPQVNRDFEDARAHGHEGLVLKRLDSPYYPGRRGKWWLKLKQKLETLDVVVVAVEWGHGKRAKVLSDYTFAVRGDNGELLTIGKAYSGLTDAEISDLTPWFLDHQTGSRGHAITVVPQIVLEVAFDIIQRSNLHESGYALRFPRIVRIRDDKPVSEIDTILRVDEIYREMLERERVER